MNLTAKEICEIILSCKAASVERIEIEGSRVVVQFTKQIVELPPQALTQNHAAKEVDLTPIQLTPETTSLEDTLRDELEELKISDPSRYEELLASGELINDRAEETQTHG